jgi:hypothetical protein
MLTDEQRAELEAIGITAVRTKLIQSRLNRGGIVHGLKSGDLRCSDVEVWLAEDKEMQESKRRAANLALWALISVVVGIAIAFLTFWF